MELMDVLSGRAAIKTPPIAVSIFPCGPLEALCRPQRAYGRQGMLAPSAGLCFIRWTELRPAFLRSGVLLCELSYWAALC